MGPDVLRAHGRADEDNAIIAVAAARLFPNSAHTRPGMGNLLRGLWEDVTIAARADIIECLQQDEIFTSAASFCRQYFHAWRIRLEKHTPRIPLELIGHV